MWWNGIAPLGKQLGAVRERSKLSHVVGRLRSVQGQDGRRLGQRALSQPPPPPPTPPELRPWHRSFASDNFRHLHSHCDRHMILLAAVRRLSPTFAPFAVSRVYLLQRHLVTMPALHKDPYRALLLLPPAPTSSTYDSVKAAYSAPLSSVLRELRRAQEPALLEIALPCPHIYGHLNGA